MNQNFNFMAFTIQLHTNLSAGIAQMQHDHPKTSLKVFDLYSLIFKVMKNETVYAVNNTVDPCMNMTKNGTVLRPCTNPNSYVFFDEYHFTGRINALIANEMRRFLSVSSAPDTFRYSMLLLYCRSLLFIYFSIK